jgi:Protein of unknown function (DUF3179)
MEAPVDATTSRRIRPAAWVLATLLAFGMLAWVATPVLVIKPFKSQTPFGVALSYELRRWAPAVTLAGTALLLVVLVGLVRRRPRWWQWAPLLVLAATGGVSTWFARQNHFEWMFNPLRDPTYAPATLARFMDDRDMVVAAEIRGDAVAWPVRQMAYHHIVHAAVGGIPVVTTY